MSGFSEVTLSQKLSELNQTAPSIQGVSLWLLHHRKHYQTYVKLWYKELGKVKPEQKLPMMYLANDLVQNSRKKYPEVAKEFGTVMKLVFTHLVALNLDSKTQNSLNRLVNIWRDRQIFDKETISDIGTVWGKTLKRTPTSDEPTNKKHKSSDSINGDSAGNIDFDQTADKVRKFIESLNDTSDLDTSEELLSSLPDLSSIAQVDSKDESKEKLDKLTEAEIQLQEQSKIIQEEIDKRLYLEKLMTNFMKAQKPIVNKKRERLKNCRTKLKDVEEAKSVIANQLHSAEDELECIPMPEDDKSHCSSSIENDVVNSIPMPNDY